MNILHVIGAVRLPRDPDHDGCSGVARATLELARAQAARGHQVCIASVGATAWHAQWHGVQLTQLVHRPWAQLNAAGRRLDFSVHLPYMALTRRRAFDVIHSHMYPYLRFLRARTRIVHVHNDPHSMGEPELAQSVRFSDAQVGVSEFVARQLRDRAPGTPVYTVYNGVDAGQFGTPRALAERQTLRTQWGVADDDVAFLFAGAIVPEKGVLELGRAFARLSAKERGVHLVLAGDAGLWDMTVQPHQGARSYHAQLLEELGAVSGTGRVHILGRVNAQQMAGVYAACDVLTVPSHTETFSLVALEGMASGRPVIASAVGGLPEVIGVGAGVLVDVQDDLALEAAMRQLAADPGRRRALGSLACGRVQTLTWNAAAHALDAIYDHHSGSRIGRRAGQSWTSGG